MPDPDLGYAVTLEPEAAIRYFEAKGLRVSFRWQDVWAEAHARAFTVAGVTRLDMLKDIRDAVQHALVAGQGEREFTNSMADVLRSRGWWGKLDAVNPKTGEVRRVSMTPARLGLIYRQNTQAAFNAGRYKAQRETADVMPYWRYVAVMDAKTRPAHARLHNQVFLADDPVWGAIYPPNGWGCRCRVQALTRRALERSGLSLTPDGARQLVEKSISVTDSSGAASTRTVRGYRGAGGTAWMDAGFDYNPGQYFVRDLLASVPTVPPEGLYADWKVLGRPDLRAVPDALRLPPPALLPQAQSADEAVRMLEEALGFTDADTRYREVKTPLGTRVLSRALLPHMVAKRPDARERFARYLLPTLKSPFEVWLLPHRDATLREHYIGLFAGESASLLVVVRVNRDGTLLYNVMQGTEKTLNKARKGYLVWAGKERRPG